MWHLTCRQYCADWKAISSCSLLILSSLSEMVSLKMECSWLNSITLLLQPSAHHSFTSLWRCCFIIQSLVNSYKISPWTRTSLKFGNLHSGKKSAGSDCTYNIHNVQHVIFHKHHVKAQIISFLWLSPHIKVVRLEKHHYLHSWMLLTLKQSFK